MNRPTASRPKGGFFRRLLRDTTGQDLVEYAMLFAIITLSAIIAVNQVSFKVGNYFTDTQARIAGGGGGGAGAGDGGGEPGGGGGGGGTGGGGGGTGGG